MAIFVDRPDEALTRWDQLTAQRRVVAIAGADAHASLGLSQEDNPYGDGSLVALPGYRPSFETFSVSLPSLTLTGRATADAAAVVAEIRQGHVFSSIDGRASPGQLTFSARSGDQIAQGGDAIDATGAVQFAVETNAPDGSRIELLRNGHSVASARAASLRHETAGERAAYRVEVYLPGQGRAPMLWLLTNPIYVGDWGDRPGPAFVPTQEAPQYTGGVPGDGWGIETSRKAVGILDVVPDTKDGELLLHYALHGAAGESPYVALGMPAGPDMRRFERVAFRARADRPMRIWVQIWTAVAAGNQYWRRSVYLDETMREISIPFAEMLPANRSAPRRAPLAGILSMMFVVDGVHTPPGVAGRLWIDDVRYQR
jgi:hypothetical protein